MRPASGLLAIAVPGFAAATDYHACKCRGGAEVGCTAGSDAADGTHPATAWRTASGLQQAVANSSCGDTFNFCMGGVFGAPDTPEWTRTNQDCSANPRIVRSYQPGGFTQRPKLVASGPRSGSSRTSRSGPSRAAAARRVARWRSAAG